MSEISKVMRVATGKKAPAVCKALGWVARAAAKTRTGFAMHGVKVEAEGEDKVLLVATDGRRLHKAKVDNAELRHIGLEVGKCYVAEKVTKGYVEIAEKIDPTYQFPNWKRVIPREEGTCEELHVYEEEEMNLSRVLFLHAYMRGLEGVERRPLNVGYAKDALPDGADAFSMRMLYMADPKGYLGLEWSANQIDYYALVMPREWK